MLFTTFAPMNMRLTPVVKNLLIINVLVFLATMLFPNLLNSLALFPVGSGRFQVYQVLTHMFAHAGFAHILFNMFALWSFGTILEERWGSRTFLIFYLLCGLGAAVAHMFLTNNPAVGASGAIMGLLGAFAFRFPNLTLFMFPIPFPVKAKYAIIFIALLDLFGGFSPTGDQIAHFAHLGGLVMGLILVLTRKHTFF